MNLIALIILVFILGSILEKILDFIFEFISKIIEIIKKDPIGVLGSVLFFTIIVFLAFKFDDGIILAIPLFFLSLSGNNE